MKKHLLAILAGITVVATSTFSQEIEEGVYPNTIGSQITGHSILSEDFRKQEVGPDTIANSIMFYEGYDGRPARKNESIIACFYRHLEEEAADVSTQRKYEYMEAAQDSSRIPLEREMYSALIETITEKNSLARKIDEGIKTIRDNVTIKINVGGFKSRFGLFVNKLKPTEVGPFLKMKSPSIDFALLACQNKIESYVELKRVKTRVRFGQDFVTGAGSDEQEQLTYCSLSLDF